MLHIPWSEAVVSSMSAITTNSIPQVCHTFTSKMLKMQCAASSVKPISPLSLATSWQHLNVYMMTVRLANPSHSTLKSVGRKLCQFKRCSVNSICTLTTQNRTKGSQADEVMCLPACTCSILLLLITISVLHWPCSVIQQSPISHGTQDRGSRLKKGEHTEY